MVVGRDKGTKWFENQGKSVGTVGFWRRRRAISIAGSVRVFGCDMAHSQSRCDSCLSLAKRFEESLLADYARSCSTSEIQLIGGSVPLWSDLDCPAPNARCNPRSEPLPVDTVIR